MIVASTPLGLFFKDATAYQAMVHGSRLILINFVVQQILHVLSPGKRVFPQTHNYQLGMRHALNVTFRIDF